MKLGEIHERGLLYYTIDLEGTTKDNLLNYLFWREKVLLNRVLKRSVWRFLRIKVKEVSVRIYLVGRHFYLDPEVNISASESLLSDTIDIFYK